MKSASPPLLFLVAVAMLWTGVRGTTLWFESDGTATATLAPTGSETARRVARSSLDGTGSSPARCIDGSDPCARPLPSTRAKLLTSGGAEQKAARGASKHAIGGLAPARRAPPLSSRGPAIASARPIDLPGLRLTAPTAPSPLPIGSAPPPAVDRGGRAPDRWRLSGWAFVRPQAAPPTLGQGLLGGSQTGVRASRRFGAAEAYARIVSSGRLGDGIEGAAGLAVQPLPTVPIAVSVERRQQLAGSSGRSAWAAMAAGGMSEVTLPLRFRLDGYGAAGVVGARRRDLFAEGSIVVRRPILRIAGVDIEAGAGTWAAAQPGAARVDVGPTIAARLPIGAVGARLSLDWRQRVAGDAAPQSGAALTLAADF